MLAHGKIAGWRAVVPIGQTRQTHTSSGRTAATRGGKNPETLFGNAFPPEEGRRPGAYLNPGAEHRTLPASRLLTAIAPNGTFRLHHTRMDDDLFCLPLIVPTVCAFATRSVPTPDRCVESGNACWLILPAIHPPRGDGCVHWTLRFTERDNPFPASPTRRSAVRRWSWPPPTLWSRALLWRYTFVRRGYDCCRA